ncbi:MAG TPA: aldo/keto reductase [Polyangiaceae bacterium]|jgi:aryl-alcohol dehydrogenase-like predicted oxidoreductase
MERVPFGATGLTVSRLALGCGGIGDARLTDAEAERLVLAAVDAGVTVFDAARSYGAAEERLGRILASRRDAVVLSTKGGYGASGEADWTPAAVTRGIDEACARLRTDRIDVFHLHSCPLDVLLGSGVVEALGRAREAGKVRVAAYSGDNEALAWAVASGAFGAVQCSVSVFDQHALGASVPRAAAAGIGVLAKRALGNAPWRFADRPAGQDAELSWDRMQALALDPAPWAWEELALRFAAFAPGVTTAVVGTTNAAHLHAAAAAIAKGPLAADTVTAIRARWSAVGLAWPGRI